MIAQVFLNWSGTDDDFKRVKTIVMDIVSKTDGITLQGLYIPSNKWNYMVAYNINNFENFLSFQKDVRAQLKAQGVDKISTRKLVLLIKETELGQ